MRKILVISLCLLLLSCTDSIKVIKHEHIPNAKKGEIYNHHIHLTGGKASGLTFSINISPQNSGINYKIMEDPLVISGNKENYNHILITGKPKTSGEIYLDFNWLTMGMNMHAGKEFQKRYILKVEE